MRNVLRPRLGSLDMFATTLLLSIGVVPQLGCSEVYVQDGSGGSGGSGGAGPVGPVGPGPGTTGTGGTTNLHCENPMPVIVQGIDTGLDVCEGGQYRRRAAIACPAGLPDPNPCCQGCAPNQICSTQGEVACTCVDTCVTDIDCGPDSLCMCGEVAGVCVPAGCQTGSDCSPGEECTSWDPTQGCLYYEFACTTPQDTCTGPADCAGTENSSCNVEVDGHRQCGPGGCAIGRPFLVDEVARTADAIGRDDWCEANLTPNLDGIDDATRSKLSDAWCATAKMEHASVAAFARFALQLLSFGAPAELVVRTSQAMADETKHAKLAWALTSVYGGRAVGPSALSVEGALEGAGDVASFVRLLIREGCVGETVAAVEAGEAEASAIDPVIAGVLGVIATDESSHAELAWRTLAWAVDHLGVSASDALASEIARLRAEVASSAPVATDEPSLLRHGIVNDTERHLLRVATISRAVLPCLEAIAAPRARAVTERSLQA